MLIERLKRDKNSLGSKQESVRMSKFNALMVRRAEDKSVSREIEKINIDDLPADGDVLIAVKYSTLNYKDGMCLH